MEITIKSVRPERFPLATLTDEIKHITADVAKALDNIGLKTRDYMRNYINTHRRRNAETHDDSPNENRTSEKDNLANSIINESTRYGIGYHTVGIGSIPNLNDHAPYWGLINDGGSIKVKSSFIPGHFEGSAPDGKLKVIGTQSFSYSANSGFGMSSRNLAYISPMRYIEATNVWLSSNFKSLIAQENIGKR